MTVYVIADIKVTNDSWIPEYAKGVHDIVHKHGDPAYAPYARMRQEGSDSRFQLIDDTDAAGTIPYLRKG